MVLAHFGTFHSKRISGRFGDFGSSITTLLPVAFTYGVSTMLASAVVHSRASGPPPVSSARCLPDRLSNQRGLITQLYGPSARLRFCGFGIVVWFHGWRRSTGLPSGSWSTNVS